VGKRRRGVEKKGQSRRENLTRRLNAVGQGKRALCSFPRRRKCEQQEKEREGGGKTGKRKDRERTDGE